MTDETYERDDTPTPDGDEAGAFPEDVTEDAVVEPETDEQPTAGDAS